MNDSALGFRREFTLGFRDADPAEAQVEYVTDMVPVETDAIRRIFTQVLALLDCDATRSDPAMGRLLPDGYREDREAADELRRFTQATLLDGKRQACREVLADLPDGPGRISLSPERTSAWLTGLTDVRLVLGSRLGITSDTDMAALLDVNSASDDADKPTMFLLAMYQHLTFLQESLLQAINDAPDR
ncbi:MAG: DUF2017 family protein [Mycobacteriales bacterium]